MSTSTSLVLHLWQPWADLIAMGAKTIETRTWDLKYRGPVLICGSRTKNKEIRQAIETYKSDVWADGPLLPDDYQPRHGVAVCTARLVDSRPLRSEDRRAAAYMDHWPLDWYHDRVGKWKRKIGWILEDVSPIMPFELKGRQRPFMMRFDDALLAPALALELPARQPTTTSFESRQIGLFDIGE